MITQQAYARADTGTMIAEVDPRVDPRWQLLVERQPSDVFHSPAWLSVLADTYDLEVRAQLMLDSVGQPLAGMPFCPIDDISAKRTVALPFSDYCDPLARTAAQWRALVDPLLAERRSLVVRCVHNGLPLADSRFQLVKQARWHGIDLGPGSDLLWRSLPEPCRRAIAKARRVGVEVRSADADELRRFFELHLRVRKYKYRLLAQPYRFFEQIWQQFIARGRGTLLLAIYQGAVIGATLYLEWNSTLYYKFNASDPAYLEYRPNDLLTWAGIEYALSRGCRRFDFGLSDLDQEGVLRFKRKFGADEKTISFLRHFPTGRLGRQEQQARNLLGQITGLFVDPAVPDQVSEQAGALLYRYFV